MKEAGIWFWKNVGCLVAEAEPLLVDSEMCGTMSNGPLWEYMLIHRDQILLSYIGVCFIGHYEDPVMNQLVQWNVIGCLEGICWEVPTHHSVIYMSWRFLRYQFANSDFCQQNNTGESTHHFMNSIFCWGFGNFIWSETWDHLIFLGGCFKDFWCSPVFGEDEPNLMSYIFRWVGSTTNQYI